MKHLDLDPLRNSVLIQDFSGDGKTDFNGARPYVVVN